MGFGSMYRTNGLSLMATARPRPLLIGSIHFPDRMHPPPIASLMFWRNPPPNLFMHVGREERGLHA